jgi:DNA-binding NtrC family response regulator
MTNWFAKQLSRFGVGSAQAEALASTAPSSGPVSILLVDDTPANLQVLMEALKPLGHKLLVAKDGQSALAIARRSHPALILLDVIMPGMDGYEVCRRMKEEPELSQAAVIFCSALDDTAAKVRGLQLGAVDFVTKPFEPDEVVARVNTHLAAQLLARSLVARNQALARELAVASAEKQDALIRLEWALLGSSPAMRQLRALIDSAAQGEEPVLLRSQPDCASEAVARAIHAASPRRDSPFIAVDGLRLAGTASSVDTAPFALGSNGSSRLELADGGTLYIDRIDRLPDNALAELSAYVEQAQRERDAGRRLAPDVRVIAVSGIHGGSALPDRVPAKLRQAFDQQQIKLPTLAERRDDIPVIADAVLRRQVQALGGTVQNFDSDSLKRLQAHTWPGNLRELEDVVVRSVSAAVATAAKQVRVDPALLQAGTPLGSYRLLRRLGAGGFGEVWEARHQLLARPAAVKLILGSSASDPAMVERFRREAAVTASLASPHTVTLYDFGVSESGQFYYVMELLYGIDLEKLVIRFGPPAPERMAYYLEQACRSLGEAHAHGMVHRDIKPSNLFACRLGIEVDLLKVLDFGLVRRQAEPEDARITQCDVVMGTPAFIAPEAAEGKPVEGRTDIYSLAATAWSLLAGRPLFQTTSHIGMVMCHLREPPPPLVKYAPGVPQVLADIIMASLAKNPKDRPTALQMARMLLASGLPQAWDEERRQAWWKQYDPTVALSDVADGSIPATMRYS